MYLFKLSVLVLYMFALRESCALGTISLNKAREYIMHFSSILRSNYLIL